MDIESASCLQFDFSLNLPVAREYNQDKRVMVLQDIGCTSILVNKPNISKYDYVFWC